ncbi:MAG: hypothetical protein ACK456_15525 [Pseudanabaenaceae cyanobacterium]|jgi:hypothetical protein
MTMIASKKNLPLSHARTVSLENSLSKTPANYQGFDQQFQRSFFVSMTLIALLTIALPVAISSFTSGGVVLPKQSDMIR